QNCSTPRAAFKAQRIAAFSQLILALILVVSASEVVAQAIPGGAQPGRIEKDLKPAPEPARREAPIVIDKSRYAEQVPKDA
ncbi:hypothetical protein ABTC37_20180, partial [Acinetobacter baumannii]